jgi:hypothetical protein
MDEGEEVNLSYMYVAIHNIWEFTRPVNELPERREEYTT